MNRFVSFIKRHPKTVRAISDALMLVFLFSLFGFIEGLVYVLVKEYELYTFLLLLLIAALFSNVFAKFVASRIHFYV